MDELFLELVKQVPSLAVLVWLVWQFISAQESMAKNFTAHLDKVETGHHVIETSAVDAINRNTAALARIEKFMEYQ